MLSNSLESKNVPGLRHAWLEVTHQCNLECVHCYTSSSPNVRSKSPLNLDEYKRIILEVRYQGCASIQFIGGEPTIYPGLIELIEFSRTSGFDRIEIFTNLTRLSNDLLESIKKNKAIIACSFYSSEQHVHESITKSKGSFDRTVKNIKVVVAADIPLRVGIVSVPGVNDTGISETKMFLESIGATDVGVDIMRGFGRGAIATESAEPCFADLCGKCNDGSICIDPEGNVSPCIMSRFCTIGSVREGPISAMLNSGAWNRFSAQLDNATSYRRTAFDSSIYVDVIEYNVCPPQIGGPPECFPKNNCVPVVLPCYPTR
jgi:MoaA/NifB/PqqE/SkfB family radical SAM enzyme